MTLIRPFLSAALIAVAPCAGAATLTVTTLADSGAGSLRAAITQANAAAGADTIQFQAGLAGTIVLTSGQLSVTDSLTITGPGAGVLTIDGNQANRIFAFSNTTQNKTFALSGLTLTRGLMRSGNDDSGGAVFYELSSRGDRITLAGMVLRDNVAGRKGGAISVSGADLTITDSTIIGNAVADGFQPQGGGIYMDRGVLRLERSRVIGNTAELSGGGIKLYASASSAIVTDTLFQDNEAIYNGGAMAADGIGNLLVSRSAFVGNTAGEPFGGALYFAGTINTGAPVNIVENTTFSANRSLHPSGRGGALAIWQGNLTVRNSSFVGNRTSPERGPSENAGGAVWVNNGGTTRVTLQSSLFADNTHGNQNVPIDVTRSQGTPTSQLDTSHNAFATLTDAGVINGSNDTNLFATDARVQPLTMQGGFVPVHPIAANSPVIDKGINPGGLTTDQRGQGFVRTWSDPSNRNGIADIGAYERYGDGIFRHGFDPN
ncbi:right-handed parallel beta-helix repeat-containing protein [Dokdonella sp. MW10]|uniref:right-handed parallel beta-helix repeat-containing protein n=1 Tax=Dokdonella sp. MW10 TaxID=2992926 RepID=UPI003F7DEE7B